MWSCNGSLENAKSERTASSGACHCSCCCPAAAWGVYLCAAAHEAAGECKLEQNSAADPERQEGFGVGAGHVGRLLAVSENSEPQGAGPAASEAVWTAERTNIFNKLYLQTDSRLLPRRRRGRTRTPRGTRCRIVVRSHLIPVYRPPHLIVQFNSRRRTASPRCASIT